MPRYPSFRQTIDEALTFDISSLKNAGFLKPGVNIYSGKSTWSRSGRQTAAINYSIESIHDDLKQITFTYLHCKKHVNYVIDMVAIPTNLGNGKRWYFVCPSTEKRCMKLISPNGVKYFLHRSAFPDMLYDTQKRSKADRKFYQKFEPVFELDRLHEELFAKYRKRHYRGKPTPLVCRIEKIKTVFMKFRLADFGT